MDALLYQPVFLAITVGWATFYSLRCISSPDYSIQLERRRMVLPLLVSIIFIFWLGYRPLSSAAFGDTVNYARTFAGVSADAVFSFNWHTEWLWGAILVICKRLGLDVHGWFTVIEAGYMLTALWAVKRFTPTNPLLGILFVWTSLMFFSFGTNGLRNGLACHIILLAMSYFFDDKYIIGGLLCLAAFGIHRSVILPIAGMVAGRFVVKDLRYALAFWAMSIVVSLVAGSAAINFFISLGFDDRMASYNTTEFADAFRRTGFRWDFLLYSSFPIIMGWYVCIKKKIKDDWYRTVCVTYCLCNAFWVMVIRAAFSNRFAYLSWFLYPIIIVYPLVNLPVWEDQDRKTGLILLAYSFFTLFMQVIYW